MFSEVCDLYNSQLVNFSVTTCLFFRFIGFIKDTDGVSSVTINMFIAIAVL